MKTQPIPPRYTREDDNFPVYRIHHGWFPRVFPKICAWLVRRHGIPVFEQYMADQGRPDVIHAHNTFYAGYLAAQIGQAFAIPTALTERSSNHIRGRIFLPAQKQVMRETFEKIDWVTAISYALREVLLDYGDEIDVVDNIVNTDAFTHTPPPPPTPFVFASVGTLRDVKNFPLLIRAFTQAFGGDARFQLKIGGDGPDQEKLEGLIQKLKMQEQVHLIGRLAHSEVRDLFQSSHVIVSSSLVETFGATLIEAMACGRPVIATRSGGPEGFINVEGGVRNGLLVPNDDVDGMAQGLRTLYETYETFDTQQIRAYCINRFSEPAVVEKLLNHYQRLCAVRSKKTL